MLGYGHGHVYRLCDTIFPQILLGQFWGATVRNLPLAEVAISVDIKCVTQGKQAIIQRCLTAAVLLFLAACGGGGGSSPNPSVSGSNSGSNSGSGWVANQFNPASQYKDLCANPRSTGSYNDRQGTTTDENFWLRSYSNDTYLWYSEIADVDPGSVNKTADYFDLMKTTALSPSGKKKDQFHFTYDTEVWKQLSQSGISAGYGARFSLISSSPPRSIIVAYNEPNSAADNNNLTRGASIISVDGAAVEDGDAAVLNAGLFPDDVGESHEFVVKDAGATETRTITLVSALVTSAPVQNVATMMVNGATVGYLTFNEHIAPAELQLIDAVNQFNTVGIDDLVLDLRYNGGGYLDIAAELGYMIAGPNSAGQVFNEITFNDKYPSFDPVTGEALTPTIFPNKALGFSAETGAILPSLNLSRVFILSSNGTASASEALINGLRGIGVEVILIGDTTRGKPYGFYAADNCSTTYFTVQFKGANAIGFGDFSDGFAPVLSADLSGANVTGCVVGDDLSHSLGDSEENQLAAALAFIETGSCPITPLSQSSMAPSEVNPLASTFGRIMKPQLGTIY
jgi:carboxyl-terminal processing protease